MKVFHESQINVTKRGYSIREICQSFGLSKGFLAREIKSGKLGARHLGRRIVILAEDLHVYLERARTAAQVVRNHGPEEPTREGRRS